MITKKLNLGSGANFLPGYINISRSIGNLSMDLWHSLPFNEGECDTIVAIHLIEHLNYTEAYSLLKECYRVLCPGGVIRLATPDLKLFCQKYIDYDKEFFYQLNQDGGERFVGKTLADKLMFVVTGQGHRHLYDFDSLSNLLRKAGFRNVERREFLQSSIPEIRLIDNRPKISLFVEAMRDPCPSSPSCGIMKLWRKTRRLIMRFRAFGFRIAYSILRRKR